MLDGEKFGQAVVEAVLKSIQPLKERIANLEKELAERSSIAGALIDRDGSLVLTFSNGVEKNLGVVCKEGAPGKDGKDGFDLSAFDIQLSDDGRSLNFLFETETHKASSTLTLPTMIYRGVWTEAEYQKGDTVTHQGSLFIALANTSSKPGSSDWQLAAKRGRDGKGA